MQKPSAATSTSFLDGLRGLAALYVVLCHAAGLLYTRHPIPTESGFVPAAKWIVTLNAALLYPFWRADYAVIFFFVLSGFVIHLRQARALSSDPSRVHFGIASYLFRRFRRLYPPLVFALALTLVLDTLGRRMGYGIYSGHTAYTYLNNVVPDDSSRTLIGNALFCMGLIVPAFGSDGPLWSLAYEWWFYLIYPLLWPITRRSPLWATALVTILFALTLVPNHWPSAAPLVIVRKVLMLLPAWWAGAMLAEVCAGRAKVQFVWLAPLALLMLGENSLSNLMTRLAMPSSDVWMDVRYALAQNIKALGMCGLLAALFALQRRGVSLRIFDRVGFLGDMSYTLYVIHAPVLILFTGWYMATSTDGHIPHHLGPMAIAVIGVTAIAWVIHFVTERPFSMSHRAHAVIATAPAS
jgi:peptidoglycan/LPS O-acetylase OafA/YrhL